MTAALALIAGYLFGSLSGARIMGRAWVAGLDLTRTKVVLDGTGASVITRGVSPAALQARAGGLLVFGRQPLTSSRRCCQRWPLA